MAWSAASAQLARICIAIGSAKDTRRPGALGVRASGDFATARGGNASESGSGGRWTRRGVAIVPDHDFEVTDP